jgi:hypothetical protein
MKRAIRDLLRSRGMFDEHAALRFAIDGIREEVNMLEKALAEHALTCSQCSNTARVAPGAAILCTEENQ